MSRTLGSKGRRNRFNAVYYSPIRGSDVKSKRGRTAIDHMGESEMARDVVRLLRGMVEQAEQGYTLHMGPYGPTFTLELGDNEVRWPGRLHIVEGAVIDCDSIEVRQIWPEDIVRAFGFWDEFRPYIQG